MFNPTRGNDPNLTNIFQMGWNHQLGLMRDFVNRFAKKTLDRRCDLFFVEQQVRIENTMDNEW